MRGFLMFAYNNDTLDYLSLAAANALLIKKTMPGSKVAVVTEEGTYNWFQDFRDNIGDRAFDHVIFQNPGETKQTRRHQDTQYWSKELLWINENRASAYDLTPFEETILLDADYLIQDKSLSLAWGSEESFMINHKAVRLDGSPMHSDEVRLSDTSILMYWATCVYFKKDQTSKILFDLVEHVKDNFHEYQALYGFPGNIFRNDYAFSIALHIMHDWKEGTVPSLPSPYILSSFDCDELIDFGDGLRVLVNDQKERHKFELRSVKGVNLHVMNKFSLGRNIDKIISVCDA